MTKPILFFAFISLIVLIVLVVFLAPKIPPTRVIPPPTVLPSPTFSPILPPPASLLKIINVSPSEDTSQKYLPVTAIELVFNEPVLPQQIFFKVVPDTAATTRLKPQSNNTIIISPETIWKTGITTLTILQQTKSQSGSLLKQPFVYRINTDFPDNPPADSPGL